MTLHEFTANFACLHSQNSHDLTVMMTSSFASTALFVVLGSHSLVENVSFVWSLESCSHFSSHFLPSKTSLSRACCPVVQALQSRLINIIDSLLLLCCSLEVTLFDLHKTHFDVCSWFYSCDTFWGCCFDWNWGLGSQSLIRDNSNEKKRAVNLLTAM